MNRNSRFKLRIYICARLQISTFCFHFHVSIFFLQASSIQRPTFFAKLDVHGDIFDAEDVNEEFYSGLDS